LPEADIQFKGVQAWISQGDNHQVVFFDFAASGVVTEHYHETPQWGMVVEGEMELTISGETRVYRKGDEYYISARAKHWQGLEADAEQLTSSAKKTGTNQRTSKKQLTKTLPIIPS